MTDLSGKSRNEREDEEVGNDWLAIDLRIRLLECILIGSIPSMIESDQQQAHKQQPHQKFVQLDLNSSTYQNSISLRIEKILSQLDHILNIKSNDVIRRFIQTYDLNEPLLHLPNPILNAQKNESLNSSNLNFKEKMSVIFEAENDIVQIEKDLREIELLDQRGFSGSGKLIDRDCTNEELDQKVTNPIKELNQIIKNLEKDSNNLISKYDSYVNKLSEIFISWDDILNDLENEICQHKTN